MFASVSCFGSLNKKSAKRQREMHQATNVATTIILRFRLGDHPRSVSVNVCVMLPLDPVFLFKDCSNYSSMGEAQAMWLNWQEKKQTFCEDSYRSNCLFLMCVRPSHICQCYWTNNISIKAFWIMQCLTVCDRCQTQLVK